jgi:hypothetical protein
MGNVLQLFARFGIRRVIPLITVLGALTVRAGDVSSPGQLQPGRFVFSYLSPIPDLGSGVRVERLEANFAGNTHHSQGLSNNSWFVLSLFDQLDSGQNDFCLTNTISSARPQFQLTLDSNTTSNFNPALSLDAVGIYSDAYRFAISGFDLRARPDQLLRDSRSSQPDCASVWIDTTDAYDGSGGSHFAAGMMTQFVFRKHSRYPVTIALPANMELGDDPYYVSHHYGYISGGVKVCTPLSFIPNRYGNWSITASADACYFGTTTAEFVKDVNPQIPKIGASFTTEF